MNGRVMIRTGAVNTSDVRVKYFPEYRIYKPKKTGDGSASRLQFKVKDEQYGPRAYLFWEASQQDGFSDDKNAKFKWTDKTGKITMKLEETDIGELLAVFNGVKDFVGTEPTKGLYHQHEHGNTVMCLTRQRQEGKPTVFYFKLSSKRTGEKMALAIQHIITLAEAMIIRTLLQDALSRMYGWRD